MTLILPAYSAEKELGPGFGFIENIISSPVSDLIAVSTSAEDQSVIYTGGISDLLSSNGTYTPIISVSDGGISGMEFSPNGQYIAYVVNNETGTFSLYKAGSDGSSPTLIYTAPSEANWLWITWAGDQYIL